MTCQATLGNDCLAASSLGEARVPVVFRLLEGKIGLVTAPWPPEEAQRDLLFLQRIAWETVQDYQAGR